MYTAERRRKILEGLTAAEGLERFLHTRYVGRDSVSRVANLSSRPCRPWCKAAAHAGVEECVIGMAHRGRLNVSLTLSERVRRTFAEFEGVAASNLPAGDVKYHNGFSSDMMVDGRHIHLALEFNPSHLEIVDPVVVGSVRARS